MYTHSRLTGKSTYFEMVNKKVAMPEQHQTLACPACPYYRPSAHKYSVYTVATLPVYIPKLP